MILDLGWLILANGAVLFASRNLHRRIETGNTAVDMVLFLLIRLMVISGLVLAAGATHLLCAEWLAVLAMALAGLTLVRGRGDAAKFRPPDVGTLILVAGAAIALKLLVQVWLFPPHNFDALSYHLIKVAEWIRAEGFTREMGLDSHASLPAGFELLETWWVVFLHHDLLIEMAGVETLMLAVAGVFGLAKHLALSDAFAGLAAIGYALCPGVQVQAIGCLNDLAIAGYLITSMLIIVERAPWPMLFSAACLGIGTKPTFAYAVPGIALLMFLYRKEAPRATRIGKAETWTLVVVGLILGGAWYVRNAWWFGNPLHPVGTHGLSDTMGKIQFGMNPNSLGQSFLDLVNSRIYDRAERTGALLAGVAGWGPFIFAFGTIALLAGLREDRMLRRLAFSSAFSFVLILLLSRNDPWNMRFILFLPAVFSVAAALLCSKIPRLIPIVALCLLYAFVSTLLPAEISRAQVKGLWAQGWQERSMAPFIFTDIPEDDSIGYFTDVRRKPYPLYRPDFSRRLIYLRAKVPDELIARIRESELRTVLAVPYYPEAVELFEECVRRGALQPLKGRFFTVVRTP